MAFDIPSLLIFGFFALLSWMVGQRLRSKFKEYSQIHLSSGLSGKEVAEKMLSDNGIQDVEVISVQGHLTDHYNPTNKTVNLSPEVYGGRSVAAAAVAAHECGHAIQHAKAYTWLQMRSKLVPVIEISSRYVMWVILIGILVINMTPALFFFGILLFATTTLFSFITLPVEFDASKRALAWLKTTNVAAGEQNAQARDVLKWAAMTYVVAALASLATLVYYIMIYMRNR